MRLQDPQLQRLSDEVTEAKVRHREALGGRLNAFLVEATRTEWLSALESYVSALQSCRLPIPPTLHRDMTMLRALCARSARRRH